MGNLEKVVKDKKHELNKKKLKGLQLLNVNKLEKIDIK